MSVDLKPWKGHGYVILNEQTGKPLGAQKSKTLHMAKAVHKKKNAAKKK
jgi:hypothetical protein